MSHILDFFRALPPVARYGVPAVAVLLILALIVGFIVKPAATPATVSTVRPAATPAVVSSVAAPVPGQVAASTAPAAAPAPQLGAGATGATVIRPAMPPRPLRECAREVLGIAEAGAYALERASYTPAAEREDCRSPYSSVAPALSDEFAALHPGRGYIQLTRSGIFVAERPGEYTFVLTSPVSSPRRCALFVGDLVAPLVEAERYNGQFAAPAVAALEAGHHEVALVCGFELGNFNSAAAVTASVRAPGESAPRLLQLNLPDTAAPAPVGTGAGSAK